LRVRGRLVERLLFVEDRPVIVRAWEEGREINLVADAVDPARVADAGRLPSALGSASGVKPDPEQPAAHDQLERAIERMRFTFGIDDDLRPFYERFRDDSLLGPAIRHQPWGRPGRRPDPWEVLVWAVTEQLIEAPRAHAIQRRIVRQWGKSVELGRSDSLAERPKHPGPHRPPLSAVEATGAGQSSAARATQPRSHRGNRADVLHAPPGPERIAGRAPAEITAVDLAPSRALSMVRVAREVASGRVDLYKPESDRRLLAIPGIGPWTVQLVGLAGRGEPDALPAGDLAYIKLIGRLRGLGRRATVPEVEEFFRPYAPYRGLAGTFILREYHKLVAAGPPLRIAA
jgi:3-methyladenine DNA glycosylase/8-oxoguanine DNA glycosylase